MAATIVQYLGTGRRKRSVARIFLRPGKGEIKVNNRAFESYFPTESTRAVVREALAALRPAQEAMDTTPLNLIVSTPLIPKENILLIEGIHELFGERQSMEDLWQKWEQPEIWRLPHGHISGLFVPGLTGRVLRWLSPRLVMYDCTPGQIH